MGPLKCKGSWQGKPHGSREGLPWNRTVPCFQKLQDTADALISDFSGRLCLSKSDFSRSEFMDFILLGSHASGIQQVWTKFGLFWGHALGK